MMKSIGVVTYVRNSPVAIFLKDNLETVLANYVDVKIYSLDELKPGKMIDDDIVLVMIKSQALQVKKHISDARRIVVAQRTTRESEIYKVFSIPADTRVLVVNDNSETTLEAITLFYQLGINHLNLVPYKEGEDYSDIKIAITPGESWRVPKYIGTVLDIGQRYIDISTFIEIINKLEITEDEVRRRFLKYSESIVSLDTGIRRQYKELVTKNTELRAVINLSPEGILLLNNEKMVSLYNKSLEKMFDIHKDITCVNLNDLFTSDIINVLNQDVIRDEIVEYKGRTLIVNKHNLEYFGELAGIYFIFQEVTYIKQLEQTLTKKLRAKGLLTRYNFTDIHTKSPEMIQCIDFARKAACSDLTILITGESGTGKELLAQSIHNASHRTKQPFMAFNCAAVPESIMESELFGYEGGTFTGALKEGKAGLFEQANNGTIFLDEIGDMPYSMQAKLLRVLQEQQVMRIGSQRVTTINIRVIAATNNDLRKKIRSGHFRADLYYRLNVLPIMVPPLRERKEDILYLLNYFLRQKHREDLSVLPETCDILMQYGWTGNIRELNNVAAYISFMTDNIVRPDHLPCYIFDIQEDFERDFNVLAIRGDLENCQAVLKVIADFDSLDMGAGRKSIEDFLNNTGVHLSQGEIRRVLNVLNGCELITSGIGRKGSEITLKGKYFLKWLKNRNNQPV
ncbi:sigma 54-interacting transcriptional regulator [Pelosinus sp. IPA-1]|uniref:sigma-54 interaction domain-containing protein n=1 Tax=Pelosinus sp. IPA-1 TaxID=3029569 RepID=UPI002553AFA2|nr:sigma 54-interacting transcriptional regulator [Pelosinus sp. IPA-1]